MPKPWKPTPIVMLSIAAHLGVPLLWVFFPEWWPWLFATIAADPAVLTAAGLTPRSTLLGPNLVRLPNSLAAARSVAITIDDGPDPVVTPKVLDILDAAGVKATLCCIGEQAEKHPELCRDIVRRGHEIESHGHGHSRLFSLFGPRRIRADLMQAQATLSGITGRRPRYFRATAGLRNPFLDPVLHRLGLRLASWTRRPYDTRQGNPEIVLNRLIRNLGPGDILLMHDGNAARTASGEPVILVVLPRLLAILKEQQLN